MRLYGIRVFVDDLEAARAFYTSVLGLTESWDFGEAFGYQLGESQLIVERAGEDEGLLGRFVGCSLAVDDVEATCRMLAEEGVELLGPAKRQPWGCPCPLSRPERKRAHACFGVEIEHVRPSSLASTSRCCVRLTGRGTRTSGA